MPCSHELATTGSADATTAAAGACAFSLAAAAFALASFSLASAVRRAFSLRKQSRVLYSPSRSDLSCNRSNSNSSYWSVQSNLQARPKRSLVHQLIPCVSLPCPNQLLPPVPSRLSPWAGSRWPGPWAGQRSGGRPRTSPGHTSCHAQSPAHRPSSRCAEIQPRRPLQQTLRSPNLTGACAIRGPSSASSDTTWLQLCSQRSASASSPPRHQ